MISELKLKYNQNTIQKRGTGKSKKSSKQAFTTQIQALNQRRSITHQTQSKKEVPKNRRIKKGKSQKIKNEEPTPLSRNLGSKYFKVKA